MTQPPGGFNDSALSTAFATIAPRDDPGDEEDTGISGSGPRDDGSTTDAPDIPVVAGCVVGGVLGLLVVIAVAIFLLRKHRRKRRRSEEPVQEDHEPAINDKKISRVEPSELDSHQCVSDPNRDSVPPAHSSELDSGTQDSHSKHEAGGCERTIPNQNEIYSRPRLEIDGCEQKEKRPSDN